MCNVVLKWSSETGTRVMKNHNCKNKSTSRIPSRQRTISSYMPPAPDNFSSIKESIVEVCVEFCARDGKPFETIAGEGFSVDDLSLPSTTVSVSFFKSNSYVFFFHRFPAMSIVFIIDLKIN